METHWCGTNRWSQHTVDSDMSDIWQFPVKQTLSLILTDTLLSLQPFSLNMPLTEWNFTEMESNLKSVSQKLSLLYIHMTCISWTVFLLIFSFNRASKEVSFYFLLDFYDFDSLCVKLMWCSWTVLVSTASSRYRTALLLIWSSIIFI